MLEFWANSIKALESIAVFFLAGFKNRARDFIRRIAIFFFMGSKSRVRDSIRNCGRSIDDFSSEVESLFDAPLQMSSLLSLSSMLHEQFKSKLSSNCLQMLPSFNHSLPTGHEQGTVIALDVGGSKFRVALVQLLGKDVAEKSMRIALMRTFPIDDSVRALRGHAFFDWIAGRIADVLAHSDVQWTYKSSSLPMGLSWSFPIQQTSNRTGILLDMGKGFCTSGILGQDIGELITSACRAKNLDVYLDAIVNDGSATLLSRAYRNQSTRLSLVLGTGLNAAIYLPVSVLAPIKFGKRAQSWHNKASHVLINTELSLFGNGIFPTTRWDDYINANHARPNFQPLEYLTGGRYLGEIVRVIILEAIETAGLFDGEIPRRFLDPYSLETSTIAVIECDDPNSLSNAYAILQNKHPLVKSPSRADMGFVQKICKLVSRRAAAYVAASMHALWCLRSTAEGLSSASTAGHVTIGYNGSVMEKYPYFKPLVQTYLDRMTALSLSSSDVRRKVITLESAAEATILGAAVAVCMK